MSHFFPYNQNAIFPPYTQYYPYRRSYSGSRYHDSNTKQFGGGKHHSMFRPTTRQSGYGHWNGSVQNYYKVKAPHFGPSFMSTGSGRHVRLI